MHCDAAGGQRSSVAAVDLRRARRDPTRNGISICASIFGDTARRWRWVGGEDGRTESLFRLGPSPGNLAEAPRGERLRSAD